MDKIDYQCNVESGDSGENFGCMTIFSSDDHLAPKDRLCPKCRKLKDGPPRQKPREE